MKKENVIKKIKKNKKKSINSIISTTMLLLLMAIIQNDLQATEINLNQPQVTINHNFSGHYNTPEEITERLKSLPSGQLPQMISGDTVWAFAQAVGKTEAEIEEWMGINATEVTELSVGTVVATNAEQASVAQKINQGMMTYEEAVAQGLINNERVGNTQASLADNFEDQDNQEDGEDQKIKILAQNSIIEQDALEETRTATADLSPAKAKAKAIDTAIDTVIADYTKVYGQAPNRSAEEIKADIEPIINNMDDELKQNGFSTADRLQAIQEATPRLVTASANVPINQDNNQGDLLDTIVEGMQEGATAVEVANAIEENALVRKGASFDPQTGEVIDSQDINPQDVVQVATQAVDSLTTTATTTSSSEQDSANNSSDSTSDQTSTGATSSQESDMTTDKSSVASTSASGSSSTDSSSTSKSDFSATTGTTTEEKPITTGTPEIKLTADPTAVAQEISADVGQIIDDKAPEGTPDPTPETPNERTLTADEQTFVKGMLDKVINKIDNVISQDVTDHTKTFELAELERLFQIYYELNDNKARFVDHKLQAGEDGYLVSGDSHGNPVPSLAMIKKAEKENKVLVLTGDYWDRGENSIENAVLLFAYQMLHPDKVILIMGNHDTMELADYNGTDLEFLEKYYPNDESTLAIENYIKQNGTAAVGADGTRQGLIDNAFYNHSDLLTIINKIQSANLTSPVAALLRNETGEIEDYAVHGGIPLDNTIIKENDVIEIMKKQTITAQEMFAYKFGASVQDFATRIKSATGVDEAMANDQANKIMNNIYYMINSDPAPKATKKFYDNHKRPIFNPEAFNDFVTALGIKDMFRGHSHKNGMVDMVTENQEHHVYTTMLTPAIDDGVHDIESAAEDNNGYIISLDPKELQVTVPTRITYNKLKKIMEVEDGLNLNPDELLSKSERDKKTQQK